MIKKLLLLLFIPCALLFADSSGNVWIQINNERALKMDLSKTIALPNKGTNWGSTGYNNDNYLGKIGSNSVPEKVYLEVYCNNTDDEGNFTMVSQSSNGMLYRKFKLGLAYRAKVSYQNGHANFYPEFDQDDPDATISSFYEFSKAGPAPQPLPALGAYAINLDRNTLGASGTVTFSWMDFLILLDNYNTNGDKAHLGPANDYQCILTIHVHTADNSINQTLTIPLQGYFESEPDESSGTAFLNVDNYGTILDLRNMEHDVFDEVGYMNFSTRSFNKGWKDRYEISISPSTNRDDESEFLMKRMLGRSEYDNTNSVPIRIRIEGEPIAGSTTSIVSIDSRDTRTVSAATIIQTAPGESDTKSCEYRGKILVALDDSYDTTDLESLLSGQYYCDIYFLVTKIN